MFQVWKKVCNFSALLKSLKAVLKLYQKKKPYNSFFIFHKIEFKEERKILLEIIGPELQTVFDDRQIEVEFVDMHFGTGPNSIIQSSEIDPFILEDHLTEIVTCHRVSKSIFFIVSSIFFIFFLFFLGYQINFLLFRLLSEQV